MTQQSRLSAAMLFKAALLTWPVVHLALTLCCGVNSWKLSGWGMYATAPYGYVGLNIFLLAPDAERIKSLGPALGRPRVFEVSGKESVQFDYDSLPPGASREVRGLMDTVRVLRWKSLIARLAGTLQERMPAGRSPTPALLLFSTPRSSLFQQQTYTVNDAYHYTPDGQVAHLGVYSSAEYSSEEMLRLLWQRLSAARALAFPVPFDPSAEARIRRAKGHETEPGRYSGGSGL